ncbi:MAG: quinone-dependent dihydroorotate dehydrogenase [Xanthomonadales bacterium]|nr:quinone-dependent dihydroorotate dehydrogenase [Gammaproteobacteria bacterium]MBT8053272.1 quinone-dependent dihydroorotate dehydrogenase [Gammaproteobacteria bacterium]NND56033.1 quinone-dependent dihydroorotate dehydrogenase [Xanthomonadales bacterium]NNK50312.1 quinone-dependent dihydroorotate dehydrogenase [Xanthomonadales bacterium]
MLYKLAQKALFSTDPETAHELSLESLRLGHRLGATRLLCKAHSQPVTCMGLEFPNPVGVAPGLDKNGDYFEALGDLGFGFVEIGTVTPRSQPGNPKPRVFRLTGAQAMINRLGFNNKGVDHLVRRVKNHEFKGVLGINIGKNFDTPIEKAADDYLFCMDKVYPYADYITVNISSPNTKNLRDLQGEDQLDRLLEQISERREALTGQLGRRVPIALKIAPDLEEEALPAVAQTVTRHGMDAVIATNTTLSRSGVEGMPHADEAGGLSGAPLKQKADQVLAAMRALLPSDVALIGVGGITKGQDAVDKLELGADLVQFYTGMVYRGPELVNECLKAIAGRNRE